MQTLIDILSEIWVVTQQMAPYLLFGFLMAGVLSVFVSPAFVEEHLGRRGLRQVVKAAILGVPLPLCSCGVIPVSASLRRHGAGKGATVSFLASTPQTGLDSIMVTYSLLGPLMTVFRIVAAFVSGIVGGIGVEIGAADDADGPDEECPCCAQKGASPRFLRALRYGFVTLPADIGRSMLAGLLLAGVLSAVVPHDFFAGRLGPGLVSMFIMVLVGIPLYVCSAGSVPIALAFIRMGISPGTALVFLVTGPATNIATLVTVNRILGRRAVVIYLAAIAVTAIAAGLALDALTVAMPVAGPAEIHHEALNWGHRASAIALLAVLLPSLRHWQTPVWLKRGKGEQPK